MASQKQPQVVQTLPLTFNQQFEEIVRRFPERTAFRLKTPQGYPTVSYSEAHSRAKTVAVGLIASGLKRGSRVAILSENRPEWVIVYLGIYLSGMTAVPLDTQISPVEWKRLIDDADARTIFVSGRLMPQLREAIKASNPPRWVTSFDPVSEDHVSPGTHDPRKELTGLIDWAARLPDPPVLPECQPSDIVTIIYTSGTTGTPKGVMLTQANIVGELECIFGAIHADENDALLCLLPLQHVLASVINVLVPLYLGAQVVFADTLKRTEILQALEEAGITILATVPQFFYLFHNRIQDELSKKSPLVRKLFRLMLRLNRLTMRILKTNLGKILFSEVHHNFGPKLRLFVSGGSSCDPKVAQDFHDMGFTILQGYGLTETTGACAVTRVENNVIGSVGPALPGIDIKILNPDETGTGEILIRGPVTMKGYYRNPSATAEAIKGGWFHSGDLGRFDKKQNLFVTGRKKEVIVLPNGKNIYPDELEMHYLQSPYIQEIAVIGIFSAQERGERLHAVVVPNFDYMKERKIANTREALHDQIGSLSNQLPKYKRLMSYQIQADALPRTTTRKIKRLALKKQVEDGQLSSQESAPTAGVSKIAALGVGAPEACAPSPEDKALMESVVGREVVRCMRETYHRETPIDAGMNLELDLGFDSMERVELLASLEQLLNLELPDDFGAEILAVRDLISQLEKQAAVDRREGTASPQSWKTMLSEESLSKDPAIQPRLSGAAGSIFKYGCLRLIYFALFRTLLRLESHGLEHLPQKGPYLICPNHQSYLDPFVLTSVLPYRLFRNMFFVGYSVFFSNWFTKLFARLTNIVPIDPDAQLLSAMKAGAQGLRKGSILCIFPEGGRTFDGELQEFKKGAAILARELSVPAIPVAIQGTYEVWRRDSMRIRPHKVRIRFGDAVHPSPSNAADPYQADTDRLRESVASLLLKSK
jgi:long-chain acyl-CoA synthetase